MTQANYLDPKTANRSLMGQSSLLTTLKEAYKKALGELNSHETFLTPPQIDTLFGQLVETALGVGPDGETAKDEYLCSRPATIATPNILAFLTFRLNHALSQFPLQQAFEDNLDKVIKNAYSSMQQKTGASNTLLEFCQANSLNSELSVEDFYNALLILKESNPEKLHSKVYINQALQAVAAFQNGNGINPVVIGLFESLETKLAPHLHKYIAQAILPHLATAFVVEDWLNHHDLKITPELFKVLMVAVEGNKPANKGQEMNSYVEPAWKILETEVIKRIQKVLVANSEQALGEDAFNRCIDAAIRNSKFSGNLARAVAGNRKAHVEPHHSAKIEAPIYTTEKPSPHISNNTEQIENMLKAYTTEPKVLRKFTSRINKLVESFGDSILQLIKYEISTEPEKNIARALNTLHARLRAAAGAEQSSRAVKRLFSDTPADKEVTEETVTSRTLKIVYAEPSRFNDWLHKLDRQDQETVKEKLARVSRGETADIGIIPASDRVRGGRSENKGLIFYLKLKRGGGIRVYFFKDGDQLVVLGGGNKRRQGDDLRRVVRLQREWLRKGR